jgi:hypothetical protein
MISTWLLTIQKKQAKYFAFRREKAPVESGLKTAGLSQFPNT